MAALPTLGFLVLRCFREVVRAGSVERSQTSSAAAGGDHRLACARGKACARRVRARRDSNVARAARVESLRADSATSMPGARRDAPP